MMRLSPAVQVVCGYERDSMGSTVGEDARVIQCLQDYRRAAVGLRCFSPRNTFISKSVRNTSLCLVWAALKHVWRWSAGPGAALLLALLLCHGKNGKGCGHEQGGGDGGAPRGGEICGL